MAKRRTADHLATPILQRGPTNRGAPTAMAFAAQHPLLQAFMASPDPDLALLDWLLAEALDAHLAAKRHADPLGKPTPQAALRLAAQLHQRRLALTQRLPQPRAAKGTKGQAHTPAQLEPEHTGTGTPPPATPLPPPDQGLGAVLPGLGDGTPPHTVAPTPPPALATPAGPGAVLAQAGALRHGLAQPPAAPQPQALGVAPLSRQQRRALARQQAKALKREAATARLARWG